MEGVGLTRCFNPFFRPDRRNMQNASLLHDGHSGWCHGDSFQNRKPEAVTRPKRISGIFDHNLLLGIIAGEIALKFCTEHGNITAVFSANFQNDLTTEMGVLDERDFARFEFKVCFGPMSYIATKASSYFVALWVDMNAWCTIDTVVLSVTTRFVCTINSLRQRRNDRHFTNAFFKWILLNENFSFFYQK